MWACRGPSTRPARRWALRRRSASASHRCRGSAARTGSRPGRRSSPPVRERTVAPWCSCSESCQGRNSHVIGCLLTGDGGVERVPSWAWGPPWGIEALMTTPHLPGRLGNPDLTLADDPRADPRMVAVDAPRGSGRADAGATRHRGHPTRVAARVQHDGRGRLRRWRSRCSPRTCPPSPAWSAASR